MSNEWAQYLPGILTVLAGAIGIPLALRKRKKSSPVMVNELVAYLQETGIKASLTDNAVEQAKVGIGRGSGQRSEGVIGVEDRHFDYINIVSITSQYGVNYYLDFLVKGGGRYSSIKRKKAKMVRKKRTGIGVSRSSIQWNGDDYLVRSLNYDYQLQDTLEQAKPEELKGGITVYPESKHKYNRIRTAYFHPTTELLQAVNIVASHMKASW
jgi:hypothetical protein